MLSRLRAGGVLADRFKRVIFICLVRAYAIEITGGRSGGGNDLYFLVWADRFKRVIL
jgi:hypothetical protein